MFYGLFLLQLLEMCQATKEILHPVMFLYPEGLVSYVPPTSLLKDDVRLTPLRGKKSYQNHIQIAHATMKNSSRSGSGSGFGSGSGLGSRGRGRPSRAPGGSRQRPQQGRSSGFSSVSFGDPSSSRKFSYLGVFYRLVQPLIENQIHIVRDPNCGFRLISYFLYDNENQWPILYKVE